MDKFVFKIVYVFLLFYLFPVNTLFAQNYLFCGDTILSACTSFNYQIKYSNKAKITGYQFDITTQDGIIYSGYKAEKERYTDHQVAVSKIESSTYRVLCFSVSNSPIKNSTLPLISLELKTGTNPGKFNIKINNALLVDSLGKNLLDSVRSGTITVKDLTDTEGRNNPMEKNIKSGHIKVFPNPFNNSTKISYYASSLTPLKMELFNCQGRSLNRYSVYPGNAGWNSGILNLSAYPTGTYFITFSQNGNYTTIKLMLIK